MQRRLVPLMLILALLFCLCLSLPALADSEFAHDSIVVERDIDPTFIEDGMRTLDADHNRWRDDTGVFIQRIPADYDGTTFYEFPTYLLFGEYAYVDFAYAQDCGGSDTLRLVCRVNAEPDRLVRYSVEITLFSGEASIIGQASLVANEWCAVDVDIGSWHSRDALTRVELRLDRSGGSETAQLQFAHLQIVEPMDQGLRERFLTDDFAARGGNLFISPGIDVAYLVATDNSPMLTAEVLGPCGQTGINALRFVFDNETACKQITLQYAYSPDGANAGSLTHDVGTGRQICLFDVPNADEVRYIRLIFTGAREGLITLRALNAVSVYESGIEALGTIDVCTVSADGSQIRVSGTVAHDIMIANRENRLALFRIQPWETVEQVLTDGRIPEAVAEMSIRYAFKFSLARGDYAALGASYLVALQVDDGEGATTYVPLAAPHSLVVPTDERTQTATAGAVKGVQTELISTAGQAGASLYLVDLYLDRLCNGSMSGYLYTNGSAYAYLDSDALSALDRAVRLRSAAGEAVYLRFLISDDATTVDYARSPEKSASGAVRGILLDSAAARDRIGAVTEFLASRYNGGEYGTIAGIIVGRQIDDAATYNDIGARSLSDYVDHYADLITFITNCARLQNPSVRVIVPISDRRPAECITTELLETSYDSELFLRSLFRRLDDFGAPAVGLMLESGHNPFSLDDNVLNNSALDDSQTDEEQNKPDYYNADNLGDFSSLLDSMSSIYDSMPETFLYCWTPADDTGDALSAAYAYLYYRLRFSTHAKAFIVSFAEAEAAGHMDGMLTLCPLMRYIDTEHSLAVSAPYLSVFDAIDWRDLIADFDETHLAVQTRYEGELLESPGTAAGCYAYWDFSAAHSTLGWNSGVHIGSLAVHGSGDSRALEAVLDRSNAGNGAYCEVIYRFSTDEPLGQLDRVAFDLQMEGDGTWEICIGTGSGEVRLEQTKTVEAGQRITLCLDTAVLGDTGADYLKLCVKPVSGDGTGKLCLYGVWGESDTMDDSTLAAHLRSIRRSDTVGEQADVPTVDLAWVFVICAIVIFSITIAVILGKRQEEEPSEQSRAGKTK